MRKIEVIYIIWKKPKITFRDQMNILYVEQKPWHIGRWHARGFCLQKKEKKNYFKVLELLDYFKPANLKHEAISTVELVCFLRILLSFVEAILGSIFLVENLAEKLAFVNMASEWLWNKLKISLVSQIK